MNNMNNTNETKLDTKAAQVNALRKQREEAERALEALNRSIETLESEVVTQALTKGEQASEDDSSLPIVGYTAIDFRGTRWFCDTRQGMEEYLRDHFLEGTTTVIEPVTLHKEAEDQIKHLSDTVISLSETQTPVAGYDPTNHVGSLDEIMRIVDTIPPMLTNEAVPMIPTGGDEHIELSNKVLGLLNEQGILGTVMKHALVLYPEGLHDNTKELLLTFTTALGLKLRQAELKYKYDDSWKGTTWLDEAKPELYRHLEKGDPRDVANYCMFLWFHRMSTCWSKR